MRRRGVVGLAPDILAGQAHRTEAEAADLEVAEPDRFGAVGEPHQHDNENAMRVLCRALCESNLAAS